ncbi:hypothetical protein FB45DRAFT_935332 [Roridomyces roridus]|uniref:F-box domain-containing protein n=1 Tax=Roridomyces roridus TaxID=1738132 RepID=A0AAD7BB84_9AGAR|nr:hypothetical protein FB45DRAFT_935332 [Roridomyces roridus]
MDFARLLSNNDVPSDADALAIHNRLQQLTYHHQLLDQERQVIEDAMAALALRLEATNMESSRVQQEQAALRGAISPIRRFPPEILAAVFLSSLAEARSASLYRSDDSRQPPNIFGQVCSRWRAVALATPQLWCAIDLRDLRQPLRSTHVTKFVQTSQPLLLSFNISISCKEYIGMPLAPIWHFCDRLESLTISSPRGYYQPLVGMAGVMFPSLRKLDITGAGDSSAPAAREFVGELDTFRTAPALATLRISGLPQLLDHTRFPLSQLTELRLEYRQASNSMRSNLSLCTRLEICSIICAESFRDRDAEVELPVHALPHLWSLTLNLPDMAWLLRPFSFPALRHRVRVDARWNDVQAFIHLYERSAFHLEKLTLSSNHDDVFKAQELLPFFCCIPLLKSLRLEECVRANRDLFTMLIEEVDTAAETCLLLPQLGNLEIWGESFDDVDVLAMVLESRRRQHGVAQLKRLAIPGDYVDELGATVDALSAPYICAFVKS